MASTAQKLIEIFVRFPGIGPRQAERFVYYLLRQDPRALKRLGDLLGELHASVTQCTRCYRFYEGRTNGVSMCNLCENPDTDRTRLLVIEKDVDLETVRKAGVYDGSFFVLGGLVPILEKSPEERIRIQELISRVREEIKENKLEEIILALTVSREGDNTIVFVKDRLEKAFGSTLRVSVLGRGLSTGSELEYSDDETLKHALQNRK